MMKKNVPILFLFLSLLTVVVHAQKSSPAAPPSSQTKQANNSQAYKELLNSLKNGDTKIDYKALRLAYTLTNEYSPYGTGPDETNPLFKAWNDKKYKDAIKLAAAILEDNYVEMNSHYVSSLAFDALGEKEKAEFHKSVFLGLLNSIIGGRDGKSTKNAFEVISVPEEYVVVNALGFQRGSQSLVNEENHKFDVLVVTDAKTKETVKMYFNIDIIFKGYEKAFGK